MKYNKMALLGIAGRSTSTLVRATLRATSTKSSTTARISSSSSIRFPNYPNFTPRQSRISPPSLNGSFLRRELSSMLPLHSVIASSCLVSKLHGEAATSAEETCLKQDAKYLQNPSLQDMDGRSYLPRRGHQSYPLPERE